MTGHLGKTCDPHLYQLRAAQGQLESDVWSSTTSTMTSRPSKPASLKSNNS